MLELFRVAASMVLDRSEYDRDVSEVDKSGKNLAENLSGYFEKAKKVLTGVLSAVAIQKVASGIWNLAKETSAAGDRIDKTSQALGMSRKAFQEWDYILAQSGASIDSMGMSMKTMNEAISKNSAETAVALSRLGLSAAKLQNLSPEQQFEELVRAFQRMPAGAKKSEYAMLLFGRNAQSLMPLLNSASGSIDELREQAHKLGLIMSDEDVDASVAFGDALDDLSRTWTSFKYKIGAQLLPGMTSSLKNLAGSVGNISTALVGAFKTGDWGLFFNTISTEIGRLIPGIVDKAIAIVNGIFANADKLVGLAVSIVNGLITGITGAIPVLVEKLPSMVDTVWTGLKGTIESLGNWIVDTLNTTFGTNIPKIDFSGITSAWQWIMDNQQSIVTAIQAILAAFVVAKIARFVSKLNPMTLVLEAIAAAILLVVQNWDQIKPILDTAWKLTVTFFRKQWTLITSAFDNLTKWVSMTWEASVKWVRKQWTLITSAFDSLGKWVGSVWNATVTWARQKWTLITSAFSLLGDWVATAWKATVMWVRNGWQLITGAFSNAREWVKEKFKATIMWVRNGWQLVTGAFANAREWVKEKFKATVMWVRNGWQLITTAFDNAREWVKEKFKATVMWVRNGWQMITSAFTNAREWVKEKFKATVMWVRNGWAVITGAFNSVKEWVKERFKAIVSWSREKWTLITSAFDSLKNWMAEKREVTVKWIRTGWTLLKGSFDTVANWLRGKTKEITIKFLAKVAEWIERIKNWLFGKDEDGKELGSVDIDFGVKTINDWFTKISNWIANGPGILINFGVGLIDDAIKTISNWVNHGVRVAVDFFNKGVESATNDTGMFQGGDASGLGFGETFDVFDQYNQTYPEAHGLNYVPYDGFRALLHRGEAVLNQDQGRDWRQNNGGFNAQQLYATVASAVAAAVGDIQINMNGKAVANAVSGQVSRNLYQDALGRRYAPV